MSVEPENSELESLSHLRRTGRYGWSVRRVLAVAGIITAVVGIAYGGWFGYHLWADWRDVERVAFDPGTARARLNASPSLPGSPDQFVDEGPVEFTNEIPPSNPPTRVLESDLIEAARSAFTPTTTTVAPGLPAPPASPPIGLTGYLLIGSDGTPSAGNADAIFLLVDSGGTKTLVSVPRSLYINNPCTDTPMRLSLLLRGCPGVAGGADLVALALEDFTGVQIAHFIVIGYSGFPRIVDSLGGVEICSDTPRGLGGQIIVPAGCNLLAGGAASFWVTNRAQDEFVDGQWRAVAGDDELSRLQRERVAMFAVYARIGSLGSAGALASMAQSVSGTFALDSGLSISGAARLAWSARGGMRQLSIPVRSELTTDGRSVLYPTEPFSVTFGG